MAALALSLLVPAVVAFVGVTALWPAGPGGRTPLLRACVALGLGLGFSSWAYFLWLVAAGPPGPGFVAAELVALVVLLGVFVRLRRSWRAADPAPAAEPAGAGRLGVALVVVFAAVCAARLVQVVGLNAQRPHSDGDAIFIWNLKARLLYRAGDDWRLLFGFANPNNATVALAPPDYPLLVPASVAGCLALLYAAVAAVRGRGQGAIAGLALAATPWFVHLGSAQVADIPLSFYMLAAVALLVLYDAGGGADRRWVVLAGLVAGLAGWAKNEGCLFVAVLFVVRLLLVAARSGRRAAARESAALALGLLPFGCLLLYFRLGLVPAANYLLADQGGQTTLERLADPGRYRAVLGHLFVQLFWPGHRLHTSSIGAVVLLAPVYRMLLGRAPAAARRAAATPALVTLLMLLGYVLVYLTTPLELQGHLRSSLHRLLMHLWPLALLWLALASATPEEALARGKEAPAG